MIPRTFGQAAAAVAIAAVLAAFPATAPAHAHGIAGNRYFPGTLTFDDPAIADEWVTQFSRLAEPAGDGTVATDTTIAGSFSRLLTPTLLVGLDTGWTRRERSGLPAQSGLEMTRLTAKTLVYENDPHEMLISAGFAWGIGHSGAQSIGADQATTLQPGLFLGKGFGDMPDRFSWLRPFGITAGVAPEFVTRYQSTMTGVTSSGRFGPVNLRDSNVLHWGFALEFSTLYLTDRFTGGPPAEEPLNQLVPLVEFAFDTPFGQGSNGKTAATVNPGLSYVAETYQLAAEAILPLDREAGRGVGVRAQLLFFLDDLIPAWFAKPVLSP